MKKYYLAPIIVKTMKFGGEEIAFKNTNYAKETGLVGISPVFKTKRQSLKFYKGEPIVVEEVSND